MTFRPTLNSNKEKTLSILLAIFAIILILLSGVFNYFVGMYQLFALVLAVTAIQIYMKYVGSDYIYSAEEDTFKIYKVTGKKSICVCSLDYDMSLTQVVPFDEYTNNKDNFPKHVKYVNFTKNMTSGVYSVYFFEFRGKITMMKFEPDIVFTDALNDKIRLALSQDEQDSEE